MNLSREYNVYSYRSDPRVPAFDDTGPVTFMDGNCTVCSVGARLIARFDRAAEFRICPIQSPLGQAVLGHYGLRADDPETWLLLIDGQVYGSMDAMIRAGARVGGVGYLLQVFRLLPRPAQDWIYTRIARNRYRMFGRTEICEIPDPALQARIIG